jgi:hypothetical protein
VALYDPAFKHAIGNSKSSGTHSGAAGGVENKLSPTLNTSIHLSKLSDGTEPEANLAEHLATHTPAFHNQLWRLLGTSTLPTLSFLPLLYTLRSPV